jgi:hypothetical protein
MSLQFAHDQCTKWVEVIGRMEEMRLLKWMS